MKPIFIRPINFAASFHRVKGSYYDFVAEIYTPSQEVELAVTSYLQDRGWQKIQPKDTLLVIYEKDRHIIRCGRVWT